jgi:hypothetical protein
MWRSRARCRKGRRLQRSARAGSGRAHPPVPESAGRCSSCAGGSLPPDEQRRRTRKRRLEADGSATHCPYRSKDLGAVTQGSGAETESDHRLLQPRDPLLMVPQLRRDVRDVLLLQRQAHCLADERPHRQARAVASASTSASSSSVTRNPRVGMAQVVDTVAVALSASRVPRCRLRRAFLCKRLTRPDASKMLSGGCARTSLS